MTILDKLNSDLKIAQAELLVLSKIPGEVSFVLCKSTKAKIESINNQIMEIKLLQYKDNIDRRDGSYTC